MKQICKILLIFLWLPLLAFSCPPTGDSEDKFIEREERGYSTPLDDMERTGYILKQEYSQAVLRKVPDNNKDKYIYGVYSYAGFGVILYPNYEYIISYSCDMCGGSEILEVGVWEYKDSVVSFNANFKKKEADFIGIDHFIETMGEYSQLNFFVKEKGNHIGDSVLITNSKLNKVKNNKNVYHYLTRIKYYTNWQAHLENAKTMKKN